MLPAIKVFLLTIATVSTAQSITSASSVQTTAVTSCHFHGATQLCINGEGHEGVISPTPTNTESAPAQYTGCHHHGSDLFCMAGDIEVQFIEEEEEDHDHDHDHSEEETTRAATTSVSTGATASDVTSTTSANIASITAVTGCHFHEGSQYCIAPDGTEGEILPAPTSTAGAPTEYTGCHQHETDIFCMNGSQEVQFIVENQEGDSTQTAESASSTDGVSCHFHAGVEHCVDAQGNTVQNTCDFVPRDRNVNLRVGLLFGMLGATTLAVALPLVISKFAKVDMEGPLFTIVKQFGTGVILSTAFVHLLTHSQLLFANECIGRLAYESTSTAIAMAGIFLAFLLEFSFNRLLLFRKQSVSPSLDNESEQNQIKVSEKSMTTFTNDVHPTHSHDFNQVDPKDKLSILLIEAGIIFHSVLIGITLVVAGDSGLITLFIVIIFHQFFEGFALGSRIPQKMSWKSKLLICTGFAITTPIGMGIGIGVLGHFNGNDKSTVIALGTIDALSAGVLAWTGIVDMWVADWINGKLKNAPFWETLLSLIALVAGIILMSFLGKWT